MERRCQGEVGEGQINRRVTKPLNSVHFRRAPHTNLLGMEASLEIPECSVRIFLLLHWLLLQYFIFCAYSHIIFLFSSNVLIGNFKVYRWMNCGAVVCGASSTCICPSNSLCNVLLGCLLQHLSTRSNRYLWQYVTIRGPQKMAHNTVSNYPKPVVGSWDHYMELDLCSVCSAAMIVTGLPFPCNLGHRPFILEVGDDKRVGKIYTILQSLKAHNGVILRPPYSCQFLGNLLRSWLKFCPLCMAEIFADHIIFQARRTQPLKDDCNAQENSRCSYCDYLRNSGGDKKRLSLAKSKLCKDLERDASRRAFSATRMDHPFLKQLFPLLSHDYTKRMLAAVTVPQNLHLLALGKVKKGASRIYCNGKSN